jgi:hypothetical protein
MGVQVSAEKRGGQFERVYRFSLEFREGRAL